MKIKAEIDGLKNELINLRRDFHRYPELGFQELRTSTIIYNYLVECGLEVQRVAKTGVVGLLRCRQPGRTLMLRADMDALPVQEQNDLPYKSLNEGIMHACGHDGHMAMLLIAVKILAKYRNELNGNIKFVFQPNEEDAGAKIMIEEGVLQNPHVDAALGLHLWAPIETGKMGITQGSVMAAHDNFRIIITGKGGHTSAPQSAIDPIIAAASIIQAAQSVQTREIDTLKPTQIMFGKVEGGTAPNVIPERVELQGTLRWLFEVGSDSDENPRKRLERIIRGICEAHRTKYQLEFIPSNPTLVNDIKMTELVKATAEKVVRNSTDIVNYVCMAGEDFADFALKVPSTFYFIGTGNSEKCTQYPHHHPKFNIDEDSLIIGVEMHVRSALNFLSK